MMRAFLHIKDFDGRSKFGTWLTRIAINSALMILRKKRSMPEISEEILLDRKPDAALPHTADQALNPEQTYSRMEREEILRSGIAGLRPSIRTARNSRTAGAFRKGNGDDDGSLDCSHKGARLSREAYFAKEVTPRSFEAISRLSSQPI